MKSSEPNEVLQQLLKDLEECRAELTPLARQIGSRGFEPSDPRLASRKWQARIAQLNLCAPAHALVRFWWDSDQLELLAEHASLERAARGSVFPYVIPLVPQPADQPVGWHLDWALGLPEPRAAARLLLWFAELSVRTFCTFLRELSPLSVQVDQTGGVRLSRRPSRVRHLD